jgi:hypothetical protein
MNDNEHLYNNIMHRPVYIKINENGDKFYHSDREMEILHREDGPAIEYADGSKAWWLNGNRHREDGPAIEDANGFKAWWLNGKRHREDGPAIEWHDGSKAWYLNDESVSQEEHTRITQKETILTLDEIAEKFGVPVEKVRIKK